MFDKIKQFFRPAAALRHEHARRDNDPFEAFPSGGTLMPEDYDELIRRKAKGRGVKLYRQVSRDSRLGALLDKRKSGVLKNRYEVAADGDSADDIRAANLCRFWMKKINADASMRGLLNSTLYGYSVSELIWQPNAHNSGYWLPVIVRNKQPERFSFTQEFELRLKTNTNATDGEPVQPGKFVVCRHAPENDNPFGTPLGHPLWWLLFFRSNGIRFWARYVDRFGAPALVIKYPAGGQNKRDRQNVSEAAESFRRDTGIIIPDNMQLEMLNMSASGGSETHDRYLNWLNEEAAVRILGSTLTTSMSGSSGSRAAGEVHERATDSVIAEDAVKLEETITNQCFRWITDINIGKHAATPLLRFDLPSLSTQISRVERDKGLAELGVIPAQPAEYFRNHFGVEIDEGYYKARRDAYLRLQGEREVDPAQRLRRQRLANFALTETLRARKAALSEASTDIEQLADAAAAEAAQRLRQELLDEVGDTVNAEEFEQLLLRKITEDPPQWLRDHMRDAMLMAHMAGEYPEHADGLIYGDGDDENPDF